MERNNKVIKFGRKFGVKRNIKVINFGMVSAVERNIKVFEKLRRRSGVWILPWKRRLVCGFSLAKGDWIVGSSLGEENGLLVLPHGRGDWIVGSILGDETGLLME